jgi:CTP synthase
MKYIIVTGGVISGVGKGTIGSSIGMLLGVKNVPVTYVKIDPYLNVDAGTINPYEHGEVFVLEDGTETDLDLGCYERFLGINLKNIHNITTGKVYKHVIEKERRGGYLGNTVQIIPHITDHIEELITQASKTLIGNCKPEVCIVEVGGTVNDLETQPFIHAINNLNNNSENSVAFVHVCYIPHITSTNEFKSKPAQESIKTLMSLGIKPDIVVCRSHGPYPDEISNKISRASGIEPSKIISLPDCDNVYDVPSILSAQNVEDSILYTLGIFFDASNTSTNIGMTSFIRKYESIKNKPPIVNICIVGKYTKVKDSYISIKKAIEHACINLETPFNISYIDCENIDWDVIEKCDAVIIAPGFGERGLEGKIKIAEYTRTNDIPVLGICFGFQAMVIEYARNVLLLNHANSQEISDDKDDVITAGSPLESLGGTMKLGNKGLSIKENTNARKIYCKEYISERHRHRYNVNGKYTQDLEAAGLVFSGHSDGTPDILELPDCKFYMGTQFHPEFKTKPTEPHPLFIALIQSISARS